MHKDKDTLVSFVILRTPSSAYAPTTFSFESVDEALNQRKSFIAIDLDGSFFTDSQNQAKTGEKRALSLNK